ncbi:Mediator complex subunit Med13 [Penicillium canariense]|uniref:Mediator of RNA polymerase II transcription subunit 13 n=1 Tax=Penicillium canariense TaxID=189055 RepID=A0A9W9I6A9_9EURO|nr:Mediator complex subunit Med13 [Penicillium canariense]KAJ5168794.1 Mediator complex subunit Med13 [Penicillium canariense]
MDFPGGATTNIHLIDGFSTIYWRIYTEESGITTHPQEGPANGYTILKHLGRLKHLEARLRNIACLASCPRRLGLWVFSPTPTFESLGPVYVTDGDIETTKIFVDTTTLKVSASGSIACQDLIKGLSSETQNQQGSQPAPSQRPQQSQPSARRSDGYSSSAAIYAAFVSAVTGALSLHLVRNYGALPIGSRSLFTAVDKTGYESPRIDNESLFSTPSLTTLSVQLNAPGTLTVSTQTIPQAGIIRLFSPHDDISDIFRVQPGTDLWLCPNGAIARLVTANIEPPTVPSPGFPSSADTTAKRTQWKWDVVQWLANFGLQIDSIDEEPWVEVEVWEPFFARLAGDAWRQNDEPQSALPLKRMLWPARFCFRRAVASIRSSWPKTLLPDPLEFAEQWSPDVSQLKPNQNPPNTRAFEEAQLKDEDMRSPRVDNGEHIESLSRMAQYPDLQHTNLVYPTPPDGAAAIGINNLNPSDIFPEDNDFLSPSVPQEIKPLPKTELSPQICIGTGRYDASDDEDLFGEMNDKDFGTKGITDADFSFFDDPDLDDMNDDMQVDQAHETPQATMESTQCEEEVGLGDKIPAAIASPEATKAEEVPKLEEPPPPPQIKPDPEPADGPMEWEKPLRPSPRPASQTISPPLSPVEIKKILSSSSRAGDRRYSEGDHQQGHYQAVTFGRKLGDWNQKYGATGKFWFSPGSTTEPSAKDLDAIPTVGLPHRGRIVNSASNKSGGNNAMQAVIDSRYRESSGSSACSSDEDEDPDEIPSEHASTPAVPPQLKRKRAPSESDIQSAASPAKSPAAPDGSAGSKVENTTFLGNFLASFSDWSFPGYFSALQIQQLPILLRREEQIPIAQLLVDQITQSSLDHPLGGQIGLFALESEGTSFRECLEDATFLGHIEKLDLKGYMSLQEDVVQNSSQQPTKDSVRGTISKLPAPHLRVRRGKEYLETLPPAMSFWETFGLEPAHGTKDISAYCIHPQAAGKAADAFLDRFGLSYQSCNFGTHARGNQSSGFNRGLKEWASELSGYASMMQSLLRLCEELGSNLSQSAIPSTNTCVVYIINPFPHAAALADICAAFWNLFQQLVTDADCRQTKQVNEVALQIIPMDFIMSEESIVVPTQTEYLNLALEVYSRCRLKDADTNPLLCAPAILLAENLPKNINFRLAPEKGSPLQDGRSLHIACSKSADQRWVSAAWSDGTGCLQTTMSYCLRYRNRGSARTIAEVRNEIWATTKHIMDKFETRWKVVLVNTEPMDPDEVDGWTNLAEQQNKMRPGSLELTIVTVNTLPDLTLNTPASPMSTGVVNPHFSSTPVSTPNPSVSIASPEQAGNAPTPSAVYNAPTPTEPSLEPDSEAVLTDIYDDSWAVVLSHRLNTSPHVTELRPALASGYLLRRKGATDSEGVFSITVNLLFSQRPSVSHENVLKDTLSMYRDLACLARARGMRSVQGNTLPWHIVTALRAQELLSYVF